LFRRVLVIGSGGSGKTTFARRLGERTGLPVIHLDSHYWSAGWTPTPKEQWTARVDEMLAAERWIMDGNYGGTMERRLAAADTVIFLDLPRMVCLWRVIRRRLQAAGNNRHELPEGCPDRLSLEFLSWIWTYPTRRRPGILRRLEALPPDKRAVVLRSQAEVDEFLRSSF
jgi:adenylate kinase family enzyme